MSKPFLIVALLIVVALAIGLFVWALIRYNPSPDAGDNSSSSSASSTLRRWVRIAQRYAAPRTTLTSIAGNPTVLTDSVLFDPYTPGIHWIGLNQAIVSQDGAHALVFSQDGEFTAYDLSSSPPTPYYTSQTAQAGGQRFVLGGDGNCYILTAGSTKVNVNGTSQPYVSPNCRQFHMIDKDPSSPTYGGTYYVRNPYQLSFYGTPRTVGFVVRSLSKANSGCSPNLWWESTTGEDPPGESNSSTCTYPATCAA